MSKERGVHVIVVNEPVLGELEILFIGLVCRHGRLEDLPWLFPATVVSRCAQNGAQHRVVLRKVVVAARVQGGMHPEAGKDGVEGCGD